MKCEGWKLLTAWVSMRRSPISFRLSSGPVLAGSSEVGLECFEGRFLLALEELIRHSY